MRWKVGFRIVRKANRGRMLQGKRFWSAVTVVYYLTILYLLCVPQQRYPSVEIPFLDKAVHGFLFVILGLLLGYVMRSLQAGMRWGVVLSGFSEFVQFFTPDRSLDVADFLFDVVGTVVGISVMKYCTRGK